MAAEIYGRIGKTIRAKREALGLSQAQLAERLGLGRTSITMIERGSQALMVHQLLQIAAALRSAPSELLGDAISDPELDFSSPESSDPDIEDLLRELGRPVRRITRA